MLPPATSANPAVLAGIEAFVDSASAAVKPDELQSPEFGSAPAGRVDSKPTNLEAVEFRGRLVDDLAASRAFVLYGPAGVHRRS